MKTTARTFDTPRPITLVVRGRAGTITLRADDAAPEVGPGHSTVSLTPLNRAGEEALPRVVVEQSRDTIAVHVPRDRGGFLRSGPAIAIDVTCPTGSTLDVKAESGDVVARGSWGQARCTTGSGDLDVEDVEGDAKLTSGSGSVSAGHVGSTLRAHTASGDVNLDETGRSSSLSTSSGHISIGRLIGSVVASTASGDVEVGVLGGELVAKTASGGVTVRRAASGSVRATGASGAIVVGVAEGTAAWLDLDTRTGRVSQELGKTAAPAEGQSTVEITARTASGDLRVHRA